jgi:hypothetical protein
MAETRVIVQIHMIDGVLVLLSLRRRPSVRRRMLRKVWRVGDAMHCGEPLQAREVRH